MSGAIVPLETRTFAREGRPSTQINGYFYGDPKGEPLVYCHGWPGSGKQAALADAAAKKFGYHILSLDRPGIGLSTFEKNRTITDWPPLISDVLDSLGWNEFHLLAVSGGCPYALATAAAHPERIRSVTICCGAALPEFVLDPETAYPIYKGLELIYRKTPWILRFGLHLARFYFAIIPPNFLFLPLYPFIAKSDRHSLKSKSNRIPMAQSVKMAFRQHPRGVLHDATRYVEPWGFSLTSIETKVCFWHGTDDHNIPIRAAQKTASQIPESCFKELSGEGHYSLPLNHLEQIVEGIRESS
ncbi:MAG: alpha/beta hydrolase [Verrucomicrobiota bacterium]